MSKTKQKTKKKTLHKKHKKRRKRDVTRKVPFIIAYMGDPARHYRCGQSRALRSYYDLLPASPWNKERNNKLWTGPFSLLRTYKKRAVKDFGTQDCIHGLVYIEKAAYITIEVPDHAVVVEWFETDLQLLPEALDQTLQEFATVIEGNLREELTPHVATGATRASIETRKEGDLHYGIGSYVYGHILRWLDLGTSRHSIESKRIIVDSLGRTRPGALRWKDKLTGEIRFAFRVWHRGTPRYDVTWHALEKSIGRLREIVIEKLREVLTK